jgi:O-acetylserine/cysteine efflux transporter
VVINGVGMLVGGGILAAGSAVAGESLVLPQRAATWRALGYVVVVGSIGVFLLFIFVLQRWTASRAVYVMVLIPFVAVALSAWLDNEPVRTGLVIGGFFVLAGVYFGALRRARPAPSPPEVPVAL